MYCIQKNTHCNAQITRTTHRKKCGEYQQLAFIRDFAKLIVISNFLTIGLIMANLIRVKDKFQITIPVALRTATDLQLGDYLEATQFEDGILFRPKRMADSAAAKPGIMNFLKETRALTRTRQDIDASVAQERGSWA